MNHVWVGIVSLGFGDAIWEEDLGGADTRFGVEPRASRNANVAEKTVILEGERQAGVPRGG